MRDTYKPNPWSSDYVPLQPDEADLDESDEAMEEYIERKRQEFYREWTEYLEGACE